MWVFECMGFCLIYKLFVTEHRECRVQLYSHVHFTLLLRQARTTPHLPWQDLVTLWGHTYRRYLILTLGIFSSWISDKWRCSNLTGALGVGIGWPGYLHLVNNVLIHGAWQPAGPWPWLIRLTQQLALYLCLLVMIKLLPTTVRTVPDPNLVTTLNLCDYFRTM